MTDDMIKLGKRAVACKGWRWMPGMLSDEGRVVEINVYGLLVGYTTGVILKSGAQGRPCAWEASASLRLPDLSDPATLGCLLALVREAYDDSALYVRLSDTTRKSDGVRAWEVLGWLDPSRSPDGRGGSWRGWGYVAEAEALVAALEGAP